MEDKPAPLVVEGLARNVFALGNSIVDMLLKRWYVILKLHSNTCKELAGMAHISTASCEEEASPKTLLIKLPVSDSMRNRRFSCAG